MIITKEMNERFMRNETRRRIIFRLMNHAGLSAREALDAYKSILMADQDAARKKMEMKNGK